jgi:hypothetical protein
VVTFKGKHFSCLPIFHKYDKLITLISNKEDALMKKQKKRVITSKTSPKSLNMGPVTKSFYGVAPPPASASLAKMKG